MSKIVILGAGTAGTMLANKLHRELSGDWSITVVDKDNNHDYQPGYLFIPFETKTPMPPGKYTPQRIRKDRWKQLADGIDKREAKIQRVDPDTHQVHLSGGETLDYDWLVIATGTTPRPDQTPGMADGSQWHKSVFDFYTMEGAIKLREALASFKGGKLLVHVTDMPIKCPVAPLEFVFLVEDYFRKRRMRHLVDITYVTPLDKAFTKPVASKALGGLLEDRSIRLAADFAVERIDNDNKHLVAYDGRELPFDLLVTVPLNMGAQFVTDSGIGDESGFVPVDKHTMVSTKHERIFAVGDATNLPTSKAGSVAHFAIDIFVENFMTIVNGKQPKHQFDGHANCFVESGRGEALLLDFNYDTQPLTGTFPLPKIGPMKLLGRSKLNHLGKLAFEQIYWNVLLPGRNMPISAQMTMAGKNPADLDDVVVVPTDSDLPKPTCL